MVASTRYHPLAEAGGFSYAADTSNAVKCLRARVTLPADHEINDVVQLFKLPAEHRVLDAVLIAYTDLDGGTTLALDVGIVDTVQDPSDTTDVDCFFDGSTVGQAGGLARMAASTATAAAACFPAVRNYDRTVQLKIATAATTPATGDVELLLYVSPKLANGWDSAVAVAT